MLSEKLFRSIIVDIKLAIIHATVWLILLWASGHPVEEWAVTALVLYISFWASKGIVLKVAVLAADFIVDYGKCVIQKSGIEIREDLTAERNRGFRSLSAFLTLLTFAVVIGASLSIGIPLAGMLGLTPLPYYFSWTGWGLLIVGLIALCSLFVLAWAVCRVVSTLVDSLNENSGESIVGFYSVTSNAVAFVGRSR